MTTLKVPTRAHLLVEWEHPDPTTTWLTCKEKGELMTRLGTDELDEGTLDPLLKLNRVPGLATEWSCAGHDHENEICSLGYLALRPSRKVAGVLDAVIERLFADGLIHDAEKEWQAALDAASQSIPRVRYLLKFRRGMFQGVCEALYGYIMKEV